MLCRDVRVAVGMYFTGIRTHAMSGKGVQQCVALQLNEVDTTENSMTICPPPERKSTRRARTRTPLVSYLVYIIHSSSLFSCCYPIRLRIISWLPTSHSPHMKRNKQTRHSKETCTLYTDLHDGVWPPGTKHKAYQI